MINKSILNELIKEYNKDEKNKITRRILNKVSITDLITDETTEFDKNFDISIKTHGITDQKSSGRCWAFSTANLLREKVIEKCNLEDFSISLAHTTFYEKLEKYNFLLDKLIKYKKDNKDVYNRYVFTDLFDGVCDGGTFDWYREIVKKYGVVPASVFPESFQSSNSYESNIILSRLARKFYLELENTNDETKLKDKYLSLGFKVIGNIFGIPQEKFDFEYTDKDGKYHIDKDITPQEFYDKYVGINLDDYIEIFNYEDKKYKLNTLYEFEDYKLMSESPNSSYLNLTKKEMKDLTLKQLKDNELVCFACYVTNKRIEGIWTDLLQKYGELLDIDLTLESNDIIKTCEVSGGHGMIFNGVKTKNNKPIKWRMENSWGDKVGDKGIYFGDDDWFDKYVCGVVINKKYLSKEQLKILDKPVLLGRFDYKVE